MEGGNEGIVQTTGGVDSLRRQSLAPDKVKGKIKRKLSFMKKADRIYPVSRKQ